MRQRQWYLFLTHFSTLSPKMASLFILHIRIFHKIEKKYFFKKLLFSVEIMHVESISFNWHVIRNANLTYNGEMWNRRRMYFTYEIIFEFILAYFFLLFGRFWPKHLFGFNFCFVCIQRILPLNLWNKLETLCYTESFQLKGLD